MCGAGPHVAVDVLGHGLQRFFCSRKERDDEAFGCEAVGYCFADAWTCTHDGDDGFVGGVPGHVDDVKAGGGLLGAKSRHL